MSFFGAFSISGSALTAQRLRMDLIAQNIANADTTKTADGTPYRRRVVSISSKNNDILCFFSFTTLRLSIF